MLGLTCFAGVRNPQLQASSVDAKAAAAVAAEEAAEAEATAEVIEKSTE